MKNLMIFLVLFLVSPHQADDLELTQNVTLHTKSGEILLADILDLEIPGLVGIRTSEGETYIPLVYLMPENQKMVLSLKPYVKKPEAVKSGPFGLDFQPLVNFADLRKIQIETPVTALVLIDPSGTFQKILKDLMPKMSSLQTELSWIPKYEYGPDSDLAQVDLILKQYNVEPPALLSVGKNIPVQSFSGITNVQQVRRIVEPIISESMQKSATTSAEEIARSTIDAQIQSNTK